MSKLSEALVWFLLGVVMMHVFISPVLEWLLR